jgi:hypothetical protein
MSRSRRTEGHVRMADAPKTLKWTEPGAFKRASRREARRGRGPDPVPWLIAAVLSALMIGAMVARGKPYLADSWPVSVAVALLVPLGMTLGVFWISGLGGDTVLVSAKGINRNGFEGANMKIRFWNWDRIQQCAVRTVEVDGLAFRALVARLDDGETIVFALPDALESDEVARAVRAFGRPARVEA